MWSHYLPEVIFQYIFNKRLQWNKVKVMFIYEEVFKNKILPHSVFYNQIKQIELLIT